MVFPRVRRKQGGTMTVTSMVVVEYKIISNQQYLLRTLGDGPIYTTLHEKNSRCYPIALLFYFSQASATLYSPQQLELELCFREHSPPGPNKKLHYLYRHRTQDAGHRSWEAPDKSSHCLDLKISGKLQTTLFCSCTCTCICVM